MKPEVLLDQFTSRKVVYNTIEDISNKYIPNFPF